MKVPYSWLREYVPDAPPAKVAGDRLAIVGTEVERIATFGIDGGANGGGSSYRVGTVLEYGPHPNADRLRLCRVDVGDGEPRQIVCGASNFAKGDRVAVVLPGGRLPDGTEIRQAKLRGIASDGMMLSERELGLSHDHAGLMILPDEWRAGSPLLEHLPLADEVLELEVTSNRPDCQSIAGVAREVAAAFDLGLKDPLAGDAEATASDTVDDHVRVTVDAGDLCPRYMARAFVDVEVGASPTWLKARLAAAGMRSINNVVDITNYVMLATGQPMHAFDADRLRGGRIVVRRAWDGETVTTLDDVERTLDALTLVICDAEKVGVVAGIMGAADVEVTGMTTRIVLESACFDGPNILATSHRLGLRSESSGRFEKRLDPHLPEVALRAASRLLVELCGASMVPGTADVIAGGGIDAPPIVELEAALIESTLGVAVPASDVERILQALGYTTTPGVQGWRVGVPHWRMHDTTRPIDLVEEVGRIWGLDRIPATLPARREAIGTLTRSQRVVRGLEDAAVGLGLHETCTYSLVEAGTGERVEGPGHRALSLANPMTSEHAELRSTLIPGALESVRHNQSLGNDRIAIFETGRCFEPLDTGTSSEFGDIYADELARLAICCAGTLFGDHLGMGGIPADVGTIAGIVDSLLAAVGVAATHVPAVDARPSWLHPARAARLTAGDVELGWLGEVHPVALREHDIRGTVVCAEIDLRAVERAHPDVVTYRPISDFPPVRQDIAVVLDRGVRAGHVVAAIRDLGGDLVERISVFDRYEGDPIPEGTYSLALSLTFRALDRTLTDGEVAEVRDRILAGLERRYDARLRTG